MAGMRSRLKNSTLSIFGDNANNRVELIKKQSNALVTELDKHAHEKFENYYALGDEVGQGAHAIVYKCIKKHHSPEGTPQKEEPAVELIESSSPSADDSP